MATKVEKKSVSFPPETLAQLDWLKANVLRCPMSTPLSTTIQYAISIAYYANQKHDNDKVEVPIVQRSAGSRYMTSRCTDDCMVCDDASDCVYSEHPTKYK